MSNQGPSQQPSSFSDTKLLLWVAALVLTFILGILATRWFYQRSQKIASENSTVLLERIRQVAKLVTVEGYFSEIYDYKDYYGYDFSFFRKKALIRVKAKVSVGYDLEKIKITTDQATKTIRISNIPPAEILSIEHDLDYYDVQEGIFNSFAPEDYSKLNANAKNFIRQRALESDLTKQASRQRNLIFETMQFMAESTGWKVEIEGFEKSQMAD